MNRKLFVITIIFLSLGLLFNVGFASWSQDSDKDVKLAQDVAQNRIMEISGLTHPQWKEATAENPQPYCDLQGRVICYMFTIEKDKKALGHILIGSSAYGHSLFEASEVLPPNIPTQTEASSILDEQLNLRTGEANLIQPKFLFYSGGYRGFYGVYDLNGQMAAVNFYSENACLFEDLEFGLLDFEKYSAIKEEARKTETRSSDYKALPVYLYDSYSDCTSPSTGCGPASGAMIASYYESLGYSSFPEWDDYPYDGELDDAYEDLYVTMGTGSLGTMPVSYGPGFVEYAQDNGYYGFDEYFFYTREMNDYWTIVDYIDNGTPMGGVVVSVPERHWYAVRGYNYDTGSGIYEIICNSPSPYNGYGSVEWIGIWEKAWNNMVAIED